MKSKKLFAILTLMAFMMTLLPMAAFAADVADHNASSIELETETADADGEDQCEIKVYLFDSKGRPVDSGDIYVFSERGEIDTITYGDDDDPTDAEEVKLNAKSPDKVSAYKVHMSGGEESIYITSNIVGTAKIAVALEGDILGYWDDDKTASNVELVGTKDITFTTAEPKGIKIEKVEGKNNAAGVPGEDGVESGTEKDDALTFANGDTPKSNGIEYYELFVRVYVDEDKTIPAKGEEVEFSCSDGDVRISDEMDETNSFGEASTKIYATAPGTYKIKVEYGDKNQNVYVRFGAPELYNIEVAKAPDPKIALDDSKATVKLEFFDAQGQSVDVEAGEENDYLEVNSSKKLNDTGEEDKLDVEVITAPDDKDEDDFKYDVTTDDGLLKISISDDDKGFEEEGTYEFKFSLDSGRYVNVKFDVVEQGDIVRLALEYDQDSLPLEGKSSLPTVKRYDADDVCVELDPDADTTEFGDFKFSVNKLSLLYEDLDVDDVIATDDVVEDANWQDINARRGKVMVTDDDKYVGDELVVTVVDTENDLTASYTFEIGNKVNGFTVTEGAAEVGKAAQVTLQLVDEDGNKVALGSDAKSVEFDSYVTSKPAGATVSADEVSGFEGDMKDKGYSTVEIKSNKAGDVKVQLVITVINEDDSKTVYSGYATAKFGAAVDTTLGAKAVTMFIGNTGYVQDGAVKTTDVAPFINPENNRTYVAVRALGEAFGAEADWDNTTKTATFTRPDMVVSITVGSNVITKVADGVTTTTEIDAPAFIKDDRTVLPFRAVGEAFGYKVNYDANTRAVSFTK